MKWQSGLKWRWIRFLMIWNRAPIRAQGGVLALIPIVAVVVSFIFAIYGNSQRGRIQYDIERRFRLVRQYNDLMNSVINAETVAQINKGGTIKVAPPKKDDAIGLLEQEIVKIAEQKDLLKETNH